jgi:hypothetical protein
MALRFNLLLRSGNDIIYLDRSLYNIVIIIKKGVKIRIENKER